MNTKAKIDRHPCFNAAVKGECGRVHLPVAPKCNILCNYCNRKYDCVNESRPGVTSAVLKPRQAIAYLEKVLAAEPRITVAGIAGPGDPFANPAETLETVRLIRERFPDLLLCLATNGLGLPPHLDKLAELGATHVTLTVNAVDPEIGSRIYSWVRDGKVIYRGVKAAEVLLARQLESIRGLKARGVTVKVNTIVIPGINDRHVPAVAAKMAALGVDILNCMPMYPNPDTPFGEVPEPPPEQMMAIRREAEHFMPQMHHCTRCRADAVGLLDADRTEEFRGCLSACASQVPAPASRPYVAVATQEGMLVNLHLGEAASFQIWGEKDGDFAMIAERQTPRPGSGVDRWWAMAELLQDCRAILVSAMGDTPQAILSEAGVEPVVMNGFIKMALAAIYGGGDLSALKSRRAGVAGGCCNKKSGEGCG
jgi:nitrogen fixation protein NifB